MNDKRRARLIKVSEKLQSAIDTLDDVKMEEEICIESTPVSLHGTERYERSQEACDYLDDAIDSAKDALEYVCEAINC